MSGWLLALLLSVARWTPEAVPVVAQAKWSQSMAICRGAAACYYDGTIHIDPRRADNQRVLGSWILHESQHHMQVETQIWKTPGGPEKFKGIVTDLVKSGYYGNAHQSQSLKAGLSGHWHELHAEIPWLLKGEIPPVLDDWYPWFKGDQDGIRLPTDGRHNDDRPVGQRSRLRGTR